MDNIYGYEKYLSEYDKDTQIKLGVYYTPLPLVKFMIDSVGNLLKVNLDIDNGLADSKVKVLDFAMGTGVFLLEAIDAALREDVVKDTDKKSAISNILKNFSGFEMMQDSHNIAINNVVNLLKTHDPAFSDVNSLDIRLTNTLTENYEVSKDDVLVIVGNPPYNINSTNKIDGLTDAYKFINGQRLCENTKAVNDDYVKFIRWAQNKLELVDKGIIAVVTNNGFIENVSLRGMRDSLHNTFDQIFIVNLHGSSYSKNELTYGSIDENVFNIKTGVAITFFIKGLGCYARRFFDLIGTKESKLDFLSENTVDTVYWRDFFPDERFRLFNEKSQYIKGQERSYYGHWPLRGIFKETKSGIITGKDSLTFDMDADVLMKRVRDFESLPIESAREKYELGRDTKDWQIAYAQKSLQELKLSEENVKDVHYRPFDIRKTYYTTKCKGFISRPKYDIMHHMLVGENVGLVFVNQRRTYGWQHSFVASGILRSCYLSSDTGEMTYVAPLYLYQSPLSENLPIHLQRQENFTPQFREWIDNHYNHTYTPEEILGYIYAVLHSQTYRTQYLEFLKRDFPRIPFVKDQASFEQLSSLGCELIQTHLMKNIPSMGLGDYCGKGSHRVEKIAYRSEDKKLHMNTTQYFSNVPKDVFEFHIGGYQVLSKYLKSRKGRTLSEMEVVNVKNVVNILAFTIEQMKKIDDICINSMECLIK